MIYFIQDSGSLNIKIGFTDGSPHARLSALQTGNSSLLVLLGAVAGTMAAEREAHAALAKHRVSGEWFRPAPDVLRHIAFMVAQDVKRMAIPATRPIPWVPHKDARVLWLIEATEIHGDGGSWCRWYVATESADVVPNVYAAGTVLCGYFVEFIAVEGISQVDARTELGGVYYDQPTGRVMQLSQFPR